MEIINELPDSIQILITIALILIVGLMVSLAALKALSYTGARMQIPQLVLSPLRTLVKALMALIIVSLVAGQFGIELMSIVTATLALVAIGFIAVWSMMSNVTATFILVVLKPFNVDDQISFAGEQVSGRVTDVNMFYTTLMNDEGERVQIPNNHFFQKVLKVRTSNLSRPIGLDEQLGTSEPKTGPKA